MENENSIDQLENNKNDDSSASEQVDFSSDFGSDNQNVDDNSFKQKVKLNKIESGIFTFLAFFGVAFMALMLVFQVILTPIKVIGTSMQPTINLSVTSEEDEDHSDIVYVKEKSSYETNDIVIVSNTNYKYISKNLADVNLLIKRVVATEGQTIKFYKTDETTTTEIYYEIAIYDEDGNNLNYDDSYIKENMYFSISTILSYRSVFPFFGEIFGTLIDEEEYSYTIPEDTYFVMGDNRNNSEDSRFFGAVDSEDISGAVEILVPYGENVWIAIWNKFKNLFA